MNIIYKYGNTTECSKKQTFLKHTGRVIRKEQIAANNNNTTYCTEHTNSYKTVNKIVNINK